MIACGIKLQSQSPWAWEISLSISTKNLLKILNTQIRDGRCPFTLTYIPRNVRCAILRIFAMGKFIFASDLCDELRIRLQQHNLKSVGEIAVKVKRRIRYLKLHVLKETVRVAVTRKVVLFFNVRNSSSFLHWPSSCVKTGEKTSLIKAFPIHVTFMVSTKKWG